MTPRLNLYGVVGRDFSSATVATWLAAHPDSEAIDVHINSPGGDLFDGLAIHNALEAHPAKIRIRIDAAALSAASYIAMSGDEVLIAKNGVFMLHEPAISDTGGNAADLEREVAKLRKLSETMVAAYSTRTRQDRKAIRALLSADSGNGTWFDADEAVAAGFADRLENTKQIAAIVGDWTPPSRIAALVNKGIKMAMQDEPTETPEEIIERLTARIADLEQMLEDAGKSAADEGVDITAFAGEFEKHPKFFLNVIKQKSPIALARREYASHLLEENDALRGQITALENRVEGLQDGVDPVATASADRFSGADEHAYKAEWDGNRPLRREFNGNFDTYSAYRKAEDTGLIRKPRKRG